jgi:hypothetical protein
MQIAFSGQGITAPPVNKKKSLKHASGTSGLF